jgi:hypothetical protein
MIIATEDGCVEEQRRREDEWRGGGGRGDICV